MQLSRHGQRVGLPGPEEDTQVGRPDRSLAHDKMDPVGGLRHPRDLSGRGFETVKVHADHPPPVVDDHFRRRDVRRRGLLHRVVRQAHDARGVARRQPPRRLLVHHRRPSEEVGILDPQRPRTVDAPRPGHGVGVRQPDEAALVIGEVEVVTPEGVPDPVGHTDDRRPLDVAPDRRVELGCDDRPVQQACGAYYWTCSISRRSRRPVRARHHAILTTYCLVVQTTANRRTRRTGGRGRQGRPVQRHRPPRVPAARGISAKEQRLVSRYSRNFL